MIRHGTQWVHSNKCNLLKSENLAHIYWTKGRRFKRRKGAKPLAGGYYFESNRVLNMYKKHLITIEEFYKMQSLQEIEDARAKNKSRKNKRYAKAKSSKN